jgi:hypothetical protein
MSKRITITVTEEAARWAQRKAESQNTSVSKLVRSLIEEQMRIHSAEYWDAYEKWKAIKPIPGLAVDRLRREEIHRRS